MEVPWWYALSFYLNSAFSTFDRDNDIDGSTNCAAYQHGAWWYKSCANSNLNGDYMAADDAQSSIYWYNLPGGRYNIKYTEMKIRPSRYGFSIKYLIRGSKLTNTLDSANISSISANRNVTDNPNSTPSSSKLL
ncbi:Tenascin-R [Apostichopus japonicus]|uniref:Tenascin-R n=1 Tax=Stichopus japonicus TaxID=307972 RepID=A0A2G8KLP7_STIJA|nr:Tenascin-R [Apostichopus japonicus]